jgi:hypothetical protein
MAFVGRAVAGGLWLWEEGDFKCVDVFGRAVVGGSGWVNERGGFGEVDRGVLLRRASISPVISRRTERRCAVALAGLRK